MPIFGIFSRPLPSSWLISTQRPPPSYFQSWYWHISREPSTRPHESGSWRCAQRSSSALTLPSASRYSAIAFFHQTIGITCPRRSLFASSTAYQKLPLGPERRTSATRDSLRPGPLPVLSGSACGVASKVPEHSAAASKGQVGVQAALVQRQRGRRKVCAGHGLPMRPERVP